MMDTFIGLQKMSATTGVSFDGLMSAFGSSLDTFQGAATKAGKLNQILGKSAFNSMELLTMTEVERAETVRNAITESGRSVEQMGKFELLALKDTLGLGSVEETRKFLRGDLKIDESGLMKGIQAKDPTALKTKNLEEQTDALAESFKKTLPATRRYGLEIRKSARRLAEASLLQIDAVKNQMKLNLTLEQAIMGTMADKLFPKAFAQSARGKKLRDRGDIMGVEFDMTQANMVKAFEAVSKMFLEKSKAGDLGLMDKTKLAGLIGAIQVSMQNPTLTNAIQAQTNAIENIERIMGGGVDIQVDQKGKGTMKAVLPRGGG